MVDNNSTSAGGDARREWTASADGRRAETQAANLLERHGMRVIARNVRCRGGEIDLVCRDAGTLVFVEVRRRRNASYGGAAASITADKQRRIILAARHYLATHDDALRSDAACRFDCVVIDGEHIDWLRAAFTAD